MTDILYFRSSICQDMIPLKQTKETAKSALEVFLSDFVAFSRCEL